MGRAVWSVCPVSGVKWASLWLGRRRWARAPPLRLPCGLSGVWRLESGESHPVLRSPKQLCLETRHSISSLSSIELTIVSACGPMGHVIRLMGLRGETLVSCGPCGYHVAIMVVERLSSIYKTWVEAQRGFIGFNTMQSTLYYSTWLYHTMFHFSFAKTHHLRAFEATQASQTNHNILY